MQAELETDLKKCAEMQRQAIAMLGDITQETAQLAANLHSNLAYTYYRMHQLELAKTHQEQSLYLLQNYQTEGLHDLLTAYTNYSVMLTDLGDPKKGYEALQKIEEIIRKNNSDDCLDYANVQQSMGHLAICMGQRDRAKEHFRKALEIYREAYEDSPDCLNQMEANIQQALENNRMFALPV